MTTGIRMPASVLFVLLLAGAASRARAGDAPAAGDLHTIRFASGRMQIDLPAGYGVTRRGMTDFTVYRFAPGAEGDGGILGIYVGFAPNFHPERKAKEAGVTSEKGRIGEHPVTWLRWSEEKDGKTLFASETLVFGFFKAREPTPGPQPASPTIHLFIRGPDAASVALLERCAGTFRDARGTGPGTGRILWEHRAGGAVGSAAAVEGGGVYFGSADGKVARLDAKSGAAVWVREVPAPVTSAPAILEGALFVAVSDGTLHRLDADTGREAWVFDARALFGASAPAVAGGKVFVGTETGVLHAVDAASGALVWKASWEGDAVGSPVITDGGVVVCTRGGIVAFLEAGEGAKGWESALGTELRWAPGILGGRVVAGGADGKVRCVVAGSGTSFWEADCAAAGPPVLHGDPFIAFVFLHRADGKVVCLDANSGRLLGAFEAGNSAVSPALVCAGGVPHLVVCGAGKVHCLRDAELRRVWTVDTGAAELGSPVVAGGRIFVGGADGRFFCLEAGDADGWPMLGGGPGRAGTNRLLAR